MQPYPAQPGAGAQLRAHSRYTTSSSPSEEETQSRHSKAEIRGPPVSVLHPREEGPGWGGRGVDVPDHPASPARWRRTNSPWCVLLLAQRDTGWRSGPLFRAGVSGQGRDEQSSPICMLISRGSAPASLPHYPKTSGQRDHRAEQAKRALSAKSSQGCRYLSVRVLCSMLGNQV